MLRKSAWHGRRGRDRRTCVFGRKSIDELAVRPNIDNLTQKKKDKYKYNERRIVRIGRCARIEPSSQGSREKKKNRQKGNSQVSPSEAIELKVLDAFVINDEVIRC